MLGSTAAVEAVAAEAYREHNLKQMFAAAVPGSGDKVRKFSFPFLFNILLFSCVFLRAFFPRG